MEFRFSHDIWCSLILCCGGISRHISASLIYYLWRNVSLDDRLDTDYTFANSKTETDVRSNKVIDVDPEFHSETYKLLQFTKSQPRYEYWIHNRYGLIW